MLVSTLLRLMMFASLISAVPSPKSGKTKGAKKSASAKVSDLNENPSLQYAIDDSIPFDEGDPEVIPDAEGGRFMGVGRIR